MTEEERQELERLRVKSKRQQMLLFDLWDALNTLLEFSALREDEVWDL